MVEVVDVDFAVGRHQVGFRPEVATETELVHQARKIDLQLGIAVDHLHVAKLGVFHRKLRCLPGWLRLLADGRVAHQLVIDVAIDVGQQLQAALFYHNFLDAYFPK